MMAVDQVQPTPLATSGSLSSREVQFIRQDFPALDQTINGHPLAYLDNGATAHKPLQVTNAILEFYHRQYSNVHRGVHTLSQQATAAYEGAREKVRQFINASDTREIIFVRGATEAINLVAATYGRTNLGTGDEIIISHMEHHSNIVPWQMLTRETGAVLKVAPISDAGELDLKAFEGLLSSRTKLVSLVHLSNALGTLNPVERLIELAHARDIPVLLDGAQAAPHMIVDVQALDCDFYAFSGHKLYGPTGIGVLYGKGELLEKLPPYQGGGDMIRSVTFERTIYNDLPWRFEAGTPNIAGALGLGAAIDYVERIGLDRIAAYERDLLIYATNKLSAIPGLRLIGTARERAGVLSFVLEGVHPHDIGTILDDLGLAVRAGHHCAQPVMERFGIPATVRASFAFYNTFEEIDRLTEGIHKVMELML